MKFNNQKELLEFLNNKAASGDKVAIIGGHYMLFYDAVDDSLKPLIKENLTQQNHRDFAELFTGEFPESSFKVSLDLLNRFKLNNVESQLVFIVNDHKFQSKNFQPNINEYIKGRTGQLRKEYYSKNQIPKYYLSEMKKMNISTEDVQNFHLKNKTKQDNLLKEGFFFSEQRLRNKFEKNLKDKLANAGKIRKVENSGAVEIYYEGIANQDICLTENGGCGCSGEVMEFLYELSDSGYTDIVFFVPYECVEAANNGFAVVADTLDKKLSIHSVYGFGGMGVSDSNEYFVKSFSVDG